MANISIGAVTLKSNPTDLTLIRADKTCAAQQTYSSVAFFSWGASIIGKEIELLWNWMEADDFAALDALYAADAPVVFDPQDGGGKTYNVEIMALDGKYHMEFGTVSTVMRRDVTMTLLMLSEVA
jgi:hypothetical protein